MAFKKLSVWCKTNLNPKKTFAGFPVECVCFIVSALLFLLEIVIEDTCVDILDCDDGVFAIPGIWLFLCGFVSYLFNIRLKEKFRVFYSVVIPVLILALMAAVIVPRQTDSAGLSDLKVCLGALSVVILALMIPWGNKFDDRTVVRNIVKRTSAILLSAVLCLIVALPFVLVFNSDTEFFYNSDVAIEIVLSIVAVVIFPFLFMNLDGKLSLHGIAHGKWTRIIFNFILSPAVMVCLFVSLLFSLYGMIDGSAMSEQIFIRTFFFLIFTFFCLWLSPDYASLRWKKFYNCLHVLLLPLLLWAWLSVFSEYSFNCFSEMISIEVLAILLQITIYVLSLFFRKFNYHLLLVMIVAALMDVCLTMVPCLDSERLETGFMKAQCERMIAKNNLLTGDTVNENACSDLPPYSRKNLFYLLARLSDRGCQENGWNELAEMLESIDESDYYDYEYDYDYDYVGDSDECDNMNRFSFDASEIDIESYSKMLAVKCLRGEENGDSYLELFTGDEEEIVKLRMSDVKAHILQCLESDSTDAVHNAMYLYPVGDYMIVFDDIVIEDRQPCDVDVWDYIFVK